MEKLTERINELTAIAKQRELTEKEKKEREILRREYIAKFREQFVEKLKTIKVIDEDGNDVTPISLKIEKEKDIK